MTMQRLDLSCAEYKLTVHRPGSLPFLDRPAGFGSAEPFGGAGQVDSSLLERLGRVVNQYRRHGLPAESGIGRLAGAGNTEQGAADDESTDAAS